MKKSFGKLMRMLSLCALGGLLFSCSQSGVFVKQNNGRFEIDGKNSEAGN
jgi:hypothetical protein